MTLVGVVFVSYFCLVNSQTPFNVASDCCEETAENLQTVLQRLTSLEKAVTTLKTENSNLRQNSSGLAAMQQELMEIKSKQQPVAFFAEMSQDLTNPSTGQTVVFDQVLTNVGNAYSPTTGIFTIPVTGTYNFNVVLSSPNNNDANHYMHFFILQNGRKIAYLFLDHNTDYWIHTSSSSVVQGTKGDRVWLSVGVAGGSHVLAGHRLGEGEIHTHISGFLIQAD